MYLLFQLNGIFHVWDGSAMDATMYSSGSVVDATMRSDESVGNVRMFSVENVS